LNNGFIWGNDDVTKDIAQKEDWNYLKRSIDIWGDCFKLRYGLQYEDNQFLWETMTEYVTKMSSMFHGIRLDNAHGTPLTVS
jgi:glycogen debranching enzyme